VSLSPVSSDVVGLSEVWGEMERMKPCVHWGMRGKSRNCVGWSLDELGRLYVDGCFG
jgi:hypothetical protein